MQAARRISLQTHSQPVPVQHAPPQTIPPCTAERTQRPSHERAWAAPDSTQIKEGKESTQDGYVRRLNSADKEIKCCERLAVKIQMWSATVTNWDGGEVREYYEMDCQVRIKKHKKRYTQETCNICRRRRRRGRYGSKKH